MRSLFILFIITIHCTAIAQTYTPFYFLPRQSFKNTRQPAAPDYSKLKYWAALPFERDGADKTPRGYTDNQETAKADVFYIHPTTYHGSSSDSLGWNAQLDDWNSKHYVDDFHIPLEASVFNGSCKVYAPYYRQVIYDA